MQGELTQKEIAFQRVEQELRHRLSQMELNDERGELMRRLEDLQGEVQHLQVVRNEKEERLRMQVARNEQLLDQLEQINMELTQAREEREQTLHGKSEQEREAERDRERLKRAAKGVDKLGQAIRSKIESCIHELSEKYQLQPP